jgi:hypothetical protein
MGINFGGVVVEVKKLLTSLMADKALAIDITLRRFTGQTFNTVLGHNVNTYDETTIKAIKLKHNDNSRQVLGDRLQASGQLQVGDVVYLIKFDDAPGKLSLKDLINDGTEEGIKIKQLKNIFDLAWAVTAEAE